MLRLTGNRDIDIDLLNRLDDRELVMSCQKNPDADRICMDQDFWQRRVFTKFGFVPAEILRKYKGDRNWSTYYIDDLKKVDPKLLTGYAIRGRLDLVMVAVQKGADVRADDAAVVGGGSERSRRSG